VVFITTPIELYIYYTIGASLYFVLRFFLFNCPINRTNIKATIIIAIIIIIIILIFYFDLNRSLIGGLYICQQEANKQQTGHKLKIYIYSSN